MGHIAEEVHSINDALRTFFFKARLISIEPEPNGNDAEFEASDDRVISKAQLVTAIGDHRPEAILIRTTPNGPEKRDRQYSNTNPPYVKADAIDWLVEIGVQHFLIDLPSVDREYDGGKMLAHRAWWKYPGDPRMQSTITEMIYVPNEVSDGSYILNLQIASFVNDASPSKPILYGHY